MSLLRGSADFLDIADSRQYAVLREYLIQHSDHTVHFSGFCCELSATPISRPGQRDFLSWSPLQRTLVLTSHSLMYVPRTTEQSGIFFDCRVSLDDVAQAIVLDSEEYGLLVQIFVKTRDASSAISAASPFPNLMFPGQQIAVTLLFNDPSVRKSMLMALCTVRPQLPILQKKPVQQKQDGVASADNTHSRRGREDEAALISSPRTPNKSPYSDYDAFKSPTAQTPLMTSGINASHNPPSRLSASRSQGKFPQAKSFGNLASYAALAAAPATSPPQSAHHSTIVKGGMLTDDEFRAERDRLKKELLDSQLSAAEIEVYDPCKAAARPPEEDPAREEEREEIRALLETRERKMSQHIEFKMKYPTKVPTRVQPGVEYDKAHEERRVLPDGHGDEELLGPSLAPLWMRWKRTGGLDGLNKRSGGGSVSPQRGAEPEDEWSVFDSAELIDSLKAREEIVYGQVGPKSQARLQRMRELVQRELHMHKNRVTAAAGRLAITGSSFNASTTNRGAFAKVTVPVPFSLSQSPVTLRRMKMVDADKMITELRQSFDRHQEAVHLIRKAQLQREVQRAQGE